MNARKFRPRAAVLLAACFILWIALEAAGVGLSFAYYAAAFGLGWCGLWWWSERRGAC